MYNQSCGCQGMNNRPCGCSQNNQQGCHCSQNLQQGCNCSMNDWNMWGTLIGCPRPQPIVAPRRVCITQQVTPVAQPVICPIECGRVNRCMYYPVFYPQYEQTFVNEPFNQSF